MRLISSRQAWHDCYYTQANSTMDSATEQLKAGITARPSSGMSGDWKKTKPGKNDNGSYRDESGKFMHQALAGKVQAAISCLPEIHRRFGMMMYAPMNFIAVEDVEIPSDWILRRVSGWYFDCKKPLSNDRLELLPYFIRALLMRHRSIVANQKDPFRKPKLFRDYMFDEYGVNLPAENFTRNYGDLVNKIICVIDDIDKECLVPVSKVVNQYFSNAESPSVITEDDYIQGWATTFEKINAYCGGLRA